MNLPLSLFGVSCIPPVTADEVHGHGLTLRSVVKSWICNSKFSKDMIFFRNVLTETNEENVKEWTENNSSLLDKHLALFERKDFLKIAIDIDLVGMKVRNLQGIEKKEYLLRHQILNGVTEQVQIIINSDNYFSGNEALLGVIGQYMEVFRNDESPLRWIEQSQLSQSSLSLLLGLAAQDKQVICEEFFNEVKRLLASFDSVKIS